MGATPSREAELSGRLVEALESDHMHTLQLLLKFVQHCEGGSPATRLAAGKEAPSARLPNAAASSTGGGLPLTATAKPTRPPPPTIQSLTDEQRAFHARAAALAQQQALAAGLQSASFPILLDLDQMKLASGESLLTAAVTKDQPAIVRLLCETGLEVDAVDFKGLTALHHAALLHRLGCAAMLLRSHACTLIHSSAGLLASQMTPRDELRRQIEAKEVDDQIALLEGLLSCRMVSNPIDHPLFTSTTSADFPLHLYRMECASEMTAVYSPTLATGMLTTEVWFRGPARRSTSDCIQMYYVDDPAHPEAMRPRFGSLVYLSEKRSGSRPVIPPSFRAGAPMLTPASSPSSSSSTSPTNPVLAMGWDCINISLKLAGLTANSPTASYRFVYFDSARQRVLAATNVFTVSVKQEAPALARALAHAKGGQPSVATSSGGVFSFIPAMLTPSSWAAPAESGSAPTSPTPVALHPSFQQLSDPSEENRARFAQSPPAYFRSYFTLNAAACTLALHIDPRLSDFKATLVPKAMTEKEFWIRYYFGMARLSDSEIQEYPKATTTSATVALAPANPTTTHALLGVAPSDRTPVAPVALNGATTFTHADDASPTTPAPASSSAPLATAAADPRAPMSSYAPPSVTSPAASKEVAVSSPAAAATSSTKPTLAVAPAATRPPPTTSKKPAFLDDEDDDGSYVPPSFAALPATGEASEKK